MEFDEWRDRISHRNDITSRITHLTNGDTDDEAFENLLSILKGKKINGGHKYVNGKDNVVCLQEAPLNSISENIVYEQMLCVADESHHYRYRAFGLRFLKMDVFKQGGRPVIYGQTSELKNILPEEEWWRIVDLDLEKQNYLVDWSHEREWRIKGNFEFEYSQTEVIVPSCEYYKKFIKYCLEKKNKKMLTDINGIITLDTIYY